MLASFWSREPFPAIMMPRFTYQAISDGVAIWNDVDISVAFDDGSTTSLGKDELLEPLHLPQRNKVLRRVFGFETKDPVDPTVVAWLTHRTAKLTGRHDARLICFTWREMMAEESPPHRSGTRRVLGRRHVQLPNGASPLPGDRNGIARTLGMESAEKLVP